MSDDLPIFSQWYDSLQLILDCTARFPRNLRPSLGHRLLDKALVLMDHLVVIRYSKQRGPAFREANLSLEQMRILVRVSFERRLISSGQYETLARTMHDFGCMLGGWRRDWQAKQTARPIP